MDITVDKTALLQTLTGGMLGSVWLDKDGLRWRVADYELLADTFTLSGPNGDHARRWVSREDLLTTFRKV